jgi:hypothetical protein
MKARFLWAAAALLAFAAGTCRADIGAPVRYELTRIQQSRQFAGVPVDHGGIAGNLQRWKFETTQNERRVFTIDGRSLDAPVVRETYVVVTAVDPYSLEPEQRSGRNDLVDVLTKREYDDFTEAAAMAPITEVPLHLVARFYRGQYAGYEVLEPVKRTQISADRFEWRSFPLSQLSSFMKAARGCDNGEDCAAWF